MHLKEKIIVSVLWPFPFALSIVGVGSNGFIRNFFVGVTTHDAPIHKKGDGIEDRGRPWEDVGDENNSRRIRAVTSKEFVRKAMDASYYSYDGSNNNFDHPLWGAKDEGVIRSFVPINAYLDGIENPMGAPHLPSPARIMEELFNRRTPPNVTRTRNRNRHNSRTSQLLPYFGEFVARDMTTTQDNSSNPMPIPCEVSGNGISSFLCTPGRSTYPFYRSQYTDGTDRDNPRVPINPKSAFLDLSNVYGHDKIIAHSLRTKVGGEVALTQNGLPLRDTETGHFITGDLNTRFHPGLLSLAVIFLRHHNILARRFAETHPDADDERLFQLARMENIAVYQNIVEEKYLPILLGDTLHPYSGYNPTVNPTIDIFFTTVAFRYGHSAISGFYHVLDPNYQPIPEYDPLVLRDVFNKTERWLDVLAQILTDDDNDKNISGLEPFLRGLSAEAGNDVDVSFVPDMNTLSNVVSVRNIQRGRDHGIPPYNTIRSWLGLPTFQSFEELVDQLGGKDVDPKLVEILSSLYGSVDLMDAYVGTLLETEFGYEMVGMVGPTMAMSIKEQFTRARDGDRFWYKYRYLPETIASFPSLTKIIKMVFPEEEMALFPADPFLNVASDSYGDQYSSDDGRCSDDGETSSLSLLSGTYTAEWSIRDMDDEVTSQWISLKLTVNTKIEGGFIGFGWGGHFMHGSIMWFCTDDTSMDRGYLPSCDDEESKDNEVSSRRFFSCCAVRGENHKPPRCDDGNVLDYRLFVERECFSEASTSVTVGAPVCSSSNTTSTANSSSSDDPYQAVDGGECFRILGRMDFIAAYNPSWTTRPHGSGERSFGTIDFSRVGIVAETVAQNPNDGLYALHGITMLGCWLVLAPTAVFVVRYMKHRTWHLLLHISLMTACGSATYPLMISALITAIERQGSMHRWIAVVIVALLPFISGAGALRQLFLEGVVVFGSFNRYVWLFHRVAGWSMLILTFLNCYLGLLRIGPQDSYIEFLSIDSGPLGYSFPIFGAIQRYVFWPYVAILLVIFATAEFYWRYTKKSYCNSSKKIWRDVDRNDLLDTMTIEEFNDATHYGKQFCIVDGFILDIAEFMNEHPGGKRVMQFVAGTDITLELLGERAVDGIYHAHSPFAIGRLRSLRIARLEESPKSDAAMRMENSFIEYRNSSNTIRPYQDEQTSVGSRDHATPSGEKHNLRFFFRKKGSFVSSESTSASIFVKAEIQSFQKVTPLVSMPDKPVIQLFLLVPRVPGDGGNNHRNFTAHEASGTAAPGSVCVLRVRDSRGDIVQRSQTPVGMKHLANGDIIYEFFISMVPGGKMSTALRKMKQGSPLLLRSPSVRDNLTRKINSKVWRCVILIAAGTGLSPMLQVIDYLLTKHSKATSNQTGTFSANRTQIFLIWRIRDSDHNYIDFCGVKERVKLSKGALKWIIIRSVPSNASTSGNQRSLPAILSERTEKQSMRKTRSKNSPSVGEGKGAKQGTIGKRTFRSLFGEQALIGDICDEIVLYNPTLYPSVTVSELFCELVERPIGVGDNMWRGGYLKGQLDRKLLSSLVAAAYSSCTLRSRSHSTDDFSDGEIESVHDKVDIEEGKTMRSRSLSSFDLSEALVENDEELAKKGGKGRGETSESTLLDGIGKHDDLLVAVSGRPKFEDECLDRLLRCGMKEAQIIRFTDYGG